VRGEEVASRREPKIRSERERSERERSERERSERKRRRLFRCSPVSSARTKEGRCW
jgi:hypothetical protein